MIDFSSNIKEVKKWLKDEEKKEEKAMLKATRAANRAGRTEAYKVTKERYPKMKRAKAKGNDRPFDKRTTYKENRKEGNAELYAETKPYSVLNTVEGSKEPENQKGKKVDKRRKIKTIVGGQRKQLQKRQFIARPKQKKTEHVFAGVQKDGKEILARLTHPSVYDVLKDDENLERIEKKMEDKFFKVYEKESK